MTGTALLAAAGVAAATYRNGDGGGTHDSAANSDSRPVVDVTLKPAADGKSLDLTPALRPLTEDLSGGKVSVAVLDTDDGIRATYGNAAFDTASIVKVDILATLLLQAQDADRHLTGQEEAYAMNMIENSDNDSTTALWGVIGKAGGLGKANEEFGLSSTKGGDGTLWGLTRTTAQDQIRLLQVVFEDKSPLDRASQSFMQDLMGHVSSGQDWGVSAAADGKGTALKNGWLQRSQTQKWDINSIGRIKAGGRDYLVAVLSNGHSTMDAGIDVVEKASQAAVSALAHNR